MMKNFTKYIYCLLTVVTGLFGEAQSVPKFSHIVIVIGENMKASSIYGSISSPYINLLASQGAKFTNSYGLSHPSQPNYIQLFSASNQGVTTDNLVTTKFTTPNLASELITANKTFTTFSDGLPSVGYDGNTSGNYARKHNPAANWIGTGTNQISTTTNQPFTAFPTDYNLLPSVSYVIPDLCHDGHDSCAPLNNTVLQYDTWISQNLAGYKNWCINNNSLLIVTFDEDDFTTVNQIATVFYGANVAVGNYSQTINHYNILRMMEDANSLTTHASATATTIDFCWSAALGVESFEKNQATLAPNPIREDILHINNIENNSNYIIFDTAGKKIKSGKISNNQIAINSLLKGIYYIQINSGDKSVTRKVIRD